MKNLFKFLIIIVTSFILQVLLIVLFSVGIFGNIPKITYIENISPLSAHRIINTENIYSSYSTLDLKILLILTIIYIFFISKFLIKYILLKKIKIIYYLLLLLLLPLLSSFLIAITLLTFYNFNQISEYYTFEVGSTIIIFIISYFYFIKNIRSNRNTELKFNKNTENIFLYTNKYFKKIICIFLIIYILIFIISKIEYSTGGKYFKVSNNDYMGYWLPKVKNENNISYCKYTTPKTIGCISTFFKKNINNFKNLKDSYKYNYNNFCTKFENKNLLQECSMIIGSFIFNETVLGFKHPKTGYVGINVPEYNSFTSQNSNYTFKYSFSNSYFNNIKIRITIDPIKSDYRIYNFEYKKQKLNNIIPSLKGFILKKTKWGRINIYINFSDFIKNPDYYYTTYNDKIYPIFYGK